MLRGLTNDTDADASAYSPNGSQVTVGVINREVNTVVKGGTPSPYGQLYSK
jgi:hypothetical protein